jgi:hypothetical protein
MRAAAKPGQASLAKLVDGSASDLDPFFWVADVARNAVGKPKLLSIPAAFRE